MSVTLQKNATTVTLPDPAPGYAVRVVRRAAIGRTAGGTVYVYDKGPATHEAAPAFVALNDDEKDALAVFFATVTSGALATFTYTDENGAAWSARFLDVELAFRKGGRDDWQVSPTLELNAMEE